MVSHGDEQWTVRQCKSDQPTLEHPQKTQYDATDTLIGKAKGDNDLLPAGGGGGGEGSANNTNKTGDIDEEKVKHG